MLSLDGSNSCGDCGRYRAHCRLLAGDVYDLKVDGDLLKTGNSFKELVYVCEPRGVVKMRKSGSRCSHSSFGDIERKGILRLGSSNAINEVLESQVDARNLLIACVTLELVDGAGKAFGFS